MKKRIALLGATGSVGDSALSVVAHFPDRFEIVSMSAGSNLAKLLPAIAAHHPKVVSVTTREDAARLRQEFPGLSVGFGPRASWTWRRFRMRTSFSAASWGPSASRPRTRP